MKSVVTTSRGIAIRCAGTLLLLLFLLAIPGPAHTQQCADHTRILWEDSGDYIPWDAANAANGDVLVCGTNYSHAKISRFINPRVPRWSKTYMDHGLVFHRIIEMNGGDLAVAGTQSINGVSALVILRLDAIGSIRWMQRFRDISTEPGLTSPELLARALVETPDGGLAVAGVKTLRLANNNPRSRGFVLKVNGTGNFEWSHVFTQGQDDEATGMVADVGVLVIAGSSVRPSTGIRAGFLQRIDAINGNGVGHVFFQLGNTTDTRFRSIEKNATGYEIGAQSLTPGLRIYNRVRVSHAFAIIENKQLPEFGPDSPEQFFYPVPIPDGGSLLWLSNYMTAEDVSISRVDPAAVMSWNNRFPLPERQTIMKLLPTADDGALAVGFSPDFTTGNPKKHLMLIRTSAYGQTTNCSSTALPLAFKDSVGYNNVNGLFDFFVMQFEAPMTPDVRMYEADLYRSIIPCINQCVPGPLRITGEKQICKPGDRLRYKFEYGPCDLPVRWSLDQPIGDIEQVNDSIIYITFHTPGTALLTASISTGCQIFAGLHQVSYTPSANTLDLVKQQSFCAGETSTLSVPSVFTSVEWSNGATGNELVVDETGLYRVRASEDGVCFQTDSVLVTKNPKPDIRLPDVNFICSPGATILNAPPGMKNYLWQDNSTSASISISTTGQYRVSVTNSFDCMASDTVLITRLSAKPAAFTTFSDSAICYGEKTTLRLNGNFRTYNWENGQSSSPTFEITKPGNYRITVTNNDGCEGSDVFAITDKSCGREMFVPTAFTPDADGINDLFRVTASAPVTSFELRIMNRWGQPVFISRNPGRGWDGTLNGVKQPAAAYVWMLRYNFESDPRPVIRKGTVILIR
ncbi:MAG: gliding motility-associated C-terminal domain-containing protein [Chitinophagaceae bacterium]|nr:MAG: gliding motility-associated C-terminal domain-containing protein [Chitinophagaceae bacterium]